MNFKGGLYVSYGMTKTGSTYAFQLTRTAFEKYGNWDQSLLNRLRNKAHGINFVNDWSDAGLVAELSREFESQHRWLVIKTHRPFSRKLLKRVNDLPIIGHRTFRDPRDTALSLLDHGQRSRRNGENAFSRVVSMDDARDGIRKHLKIFSTYQRAENFVNVEYNWLIQHPAKFLAIVEEQCSFSCDRDRVIEYVNDECFTQFNVGKIGRHRTEMSPEDSRSFRTEFSDFYERYFPDMKE